MQKVVKLEPGKFYHIYNRGNNKENIFLEEKNYYYFLELYGKYIGPIADTYAYCLMPNHFHLLIGIKDEQNTSQVLETCEVSGSKELQPSQQFSNLFNAYTKAINNTYQRTGSLFQERFGRIEINNEYYFSQLVQYIHLNPQKHGFVEDFRDYKFSSYHSHLSGKRTNLKREEVLKWFGDKAAYQSFHAGSFKENASFIQEVIKDFL
jgi:putative transposase